MTEQVRILICDDQEVVRKGLHIILSHTAGLEVVGLAQDGQQALEMIRDLEPDVVLLDLKMPRLNGIQATRRISTAFPQVKVVVLTTYDGDEWVFDALQAGAVGYLLKDASGEEIARAVREAVEGKSHLTPEVAHKVVARFKRLAERPLPPATEDPLLEALTERELSVLELMAQGRSNQEIAAALFLAEGTIKNHVSQILSKLQANDRTQAVVIALRRGIVHL